MQGSQQPLAATQNIRIGLLKTPRVPWIGHVALLARKFQQQMQLLSHRHEGEPVFIEVE